MTKSNRNFQTDEVMPEKTGKWFITQDMGNGITRIREAFIDPGVACNIWYIKGKEKNLLFDSGTGLVSLKKSFPKFFEHPAICIASHTHFDHVGGSYEFKDRRVHPSEKQIITSPTRVNTTVEGYMDLSLFSSLPFAGFNPEKYQVKPAPPASLVKDKEIIDTGDRFFEVLHLPGHSPGSIGLYERATRILFPGDVVYDGRLYDDVYHSNISLYISSMERLLTLKVDKVYPGHFGTFNQNRMHRLIHSYLQSRQPGGK